MNRRHFLATACSAGVASLSGCSGSIADPDPTITELVHPDPAVVSVDNDGPTVSGTFHNRGQSGMIKAGLYWFREKGAPDPDSIGPQQHPDIEFDVGRS